MHNTDHPHPQSSNAQPQNSNPQLQNPNAQLQYNQNLPPTHSLQIHQSQKFQLKQVFAHQMHADILTLKYDNDGEYIALGAKNGTKMLYNVVTKKLVGRSEDVKENSITSLKWRPHLANQNKILVSADAAGYITYHHVPTLKPIFTISEHHNSIHSIDFAPTANTFATGGRDMHIRVYDEEIKTIVKQFKPAGWNNVGHDNRIFAVKYIDNNVIISGGWDTVVHFWDLRQGKSVKHFYGPHLSGQSLDYHNGFILAGCYSATKQLQVWQAGSLKKVEEIDWTSGNVDDAEYVYAATFNRKQPSIFGCGSTGPNSEVRLYQQEEQHRYKQIATISKLNNGCFSLDFSNKLDQFAFSTPHHGFYLYETTPKH